MKAIRWSLAVAALVLAGGFAVAGTYDSLVAALQGAKATLSAGDQKRVDKAVVTLQATGTSTLQADVKALSKSITQLGGKLSQNAALAPTLSTSVEALYIPLNIRLTQIAFAQGTWLTNHPGFGNLARSAKQVLAYGKAATKMENAHKSATSTTAQKLAAYLAAAKAFDKALKFYGAI